MRAALLTAIDDELSASALFVLIPFCYIPASTAVYVVRERACKAKHLQLVSGTSPVAYWVATFCWDMLQYAIIVAGTMAVFVGFGNDSFTGCRAISRQPRKRKRVMQSPKIDGPLP